MSKIITNLYELYLNSTGVTTDTRKISEGNIFFALTGPNFNGNQFAKQALKLGAKNVVIDDPAFNHDDRFILVNDVLKTLQDLANHHRHQLKIPIIGITGSNGKTTTKELLACVLKTKYNTHYTQGNLNNHIGVPLSVLEINDKTEISIIEMGANKIGDIELLANIAEPTHGIITNIGKAHLKGFGSLEGVARAKSELYKFIIDHNGTVLINEDNEILARMGKRFKNPLYYSTTNKNAFCYGELIEVNPFIKLSYKNETNKQTSLIGKYNFENILAALAIAKIFNVDDTTAVDAICQYKSSNNRSQVIENRSNKILLDAYNANPTSMKAAVENFSAIKHSKKIVILGDMYELGSASRQEHEELYKLVVEQQYFSCYFVGKNFSEYLQEKNNVFTNKEELLNCIKEQNISDSLILIKGSRGIGLESIVEEL